MLRDIDYLHLVSLAMTKLKAGTLYEIYVKMQTGLGDVRAMTTTDVRDTLSTLVQVLQEGIYWGGTRLTNVGPDYLIDVTIIEAIIWQAEIIDPNIGGEIRQVLDRAVAEQADLVT